MIKHIVRGNSKNAIYNNLRLIVHFLFSKMGKAGRGFAVSFVGV